LFDFFGSQKESRAVAQFPGISASFYRKIRFFFQMLASRIGQTLSHADLSR
jgi:hypothetical protein